MSVDSAAARIIGCSIVPGTPKSLMSNRNNFFKGKNVQLVVHRLSVQLLLAFTYCQLNNGDTERLS